MDFLSIILIIFGLALFETVSSVDNAIINAQVLSTMGEKAKKWFLTWGLLVAVFVVRGALPWLIVWAVSPGLGPVGSLTATFSGDPRVTESIESSAPMLLIAGGVFMIFLFFYWLFLEPKYYGLIGEKFIHSQGVWFYAIISILLSIIVWLALKVNPLLAFGAVLGSTLFFITHGFRENAEKVEKQLEGKSGAITDTSKVFFLMVIDATFSLDGVLGAFAFTLSVPLILLGNGLGAVVVRQFTVSNIERIKKYVFLKNGAMYSILILGVVMLLEAFGFHIPSFVSPIATALIVGYFFMKSRKAMI
ncbi:MAG: hypothetical protein G01um10147_824 [Microgenomates group bacterium Gr01-1014_7]|nr:MAG: hypothetical protein G01um10147_824 [Microgenomates group bacterium Gr01-1014_7]